MLTSKGKKESFYLDYFRLTISTRGLCNVLLYRNAVKWEALVLLLIDHPDACSKQRDASWNMPT